MLGAGGCEKEVEETMSINVLGVVALFGAVAVANEWATTPRQIRLVKAAAEALERGVREAIEQHEKCKERK